ncbi:MAG: alpha/beta hydrolase [Bacteroidetes bacterium]|nr:MAG: alpha/beta hydrolase [Bacteroidota bacterium]
MKKLVLFSLLVLFASALLAQRRAYQTHTYYADDTVRLKLDLFLPTIPVDSPAPLFIFVHGGGFSGGDRKGGHALGKYLAGEGIALASISYSLYMKGRSFSCDGLLPEKVKAMQVAANQLWLATDFIRDSAAAWGLDSSRIFIGGSSAGAETVLHAAYWDRAVMDMYGQPLPADFRYLGMVSGAGALMDLNAITAETKLPGLFFHGTADPLVPYGTAAHHYCPPHAQGWLMFSGGRSIYERLVSLHETAWLYTYCGGGHSYAGYPFREEHAVILAFLKDVMAGRRSQQHHVLKADQPEPERGEWPLCAQ